MGFGWVEGKSWLYVSSVLYEKKSPKPIIESHEQALPLWPELYSFLALALIRAH